MVRRLLVGVCAPQWYRITPCRSKYQDSNGQTVHGSHRKSKGRVHIQLFLLGETPGRPHRRADQCIQAVDSNRIVDPIGSGDLANMQERALIGLARDVAFLLRLFKRRQLNTVTFAYFDDVSKCPDGSSRSPCREILRQLRFELRKHDFEVFCKPAL